MQTVLYAMLLACILWPMADAGIRWLHSWLVFKMEIAGMTANSERCESLRNGLCDWGSDCLCWAEHMHQRDAANTNTNTTGHADMEACYPSNKPPNFTPLAKMGQMINTPKGATETTDEPSYTELAYIVWEEKRNPGLVDEGTQPVEAEEDPFPGFSNLGG